MKLNRKSLHILGVYNNFTYACKSTNQLKLKTFEIKSYNKPQNPNNNKTYAHFNIICNSIDYIANSTMYIYIIWNSAIDIYQQKFEISYFTSNIYNKLFAYHLAIIY